ncbi:glycoside hydrolase family 43 protein [Echinicola jeungdonensis]|uniref:Glycoside hydrolase family 43 protein n=1 Tax=Echinicola jeungdonensis TaxID=709343 RepID=A0ABV5J9I2_9BACT|nr:glycoside hydrolase family 43 protein [Echinicola jeungdonensis]MDN3670415.1 glycoside hydrolase family 43 protein [Echinicola jeungdonensis]
METIKSKTTSILVLICGGLLLMGLVSCKSNGVGNLSLADTSGESNNTFENPILPGYYPDPSICRVGEDYYLVNSTFAYFPGVPIFHSTDLVNWNQIGHVLNRPEQIDLEGLGISRGIFAPTIQYHEGRFYMITTLVGKRGNFLVTAEDPAGPWSNPIWLPQVNGIDPSLFFDENGHSYIVYNSDPPNNEPLYNGHRSIKLIRFDKESLQTKGEARVIVNGGVDLSKKPVWIEGPHLFKNGDYYYLCAAEGGTSVNHSQVIFRTKQLDEPFVPWENNPILTQRHLDPNRENPVSATGHADLVQTQNGDWWAVFLGTRPYDNKDSYNIGRETFLAPVEWNEDHWPVINPDHEAVQYNYPVPDLPKGEVKDFPKSGSFTISDKFNSKELKPYWVFIRVPQEKWYKLDGKGLHLNLRPETAGGTSTPSYIGRRQQHIRGEVETAMEFTPKKTGEKAGLLFFQNETHHFFFGKSISEEGDKVIGLYQSDSYGNLNSIEEHPVGSSEKVYLRVEFNKGIYEFLYKMKGKDTWRTLATFREGEFLSSRVAGGFVGVTIGPYATSTLQPSTNAALFKHFIYKGY